MQVSCEEFLFTHRKDIVLLLEEPISITEAWYVSHTEHVCKMQGFACETWWNVQKQLDFKGLVSI
jgi:hypothetical protein